MDVPNIISSQGRYFADEYGVNDLILQPSEVTLVRQIAEKFGVPIQGTPTGRHVDILMRHLNAIALERMSQGDGRYKSAFLMSRAALGKHLGVN